MLSKNDIIIMNNMRYYHAKVAKEVLDASEIKSPRKIPCKRQSMTV